MSEEDTSKKQRPSAASQSFTDQEVEALHTILVGIQRGAKPRDLQRIAQSAPGANVHRKVLAMRESMRRRKALAGA